MFFATRPLHAWSPSAESHFATSDNSTCGSLSLAAIEGPLDTPAVGGKLERVKLDCPKLATLSRECGKLKAAKPLEAAQLEATD